MAVRVHELATDLEIDAGDLIKQLERLEIPVRNHMSRVKDRDTDRVYEHYRKMNNARAIDWLKLRESEPPRKSAAKPAEKPAASPAKKPKEAPAPPPAEAPAVEEVAPAAAAPTPEPADTNGAEEQHRRIEEALARARAARAQADAERMGHTAAVERQKVVVLREKQASAAAAEAEAEAGTAAGDSPARPDARIARSGEARPTRPAPRGPAPVSRDQGPRRDVRRPMPARPGGPGSDRPYSDRPTSPRPYSDRPSSDRPYSDRPTSARPTSARPTTAKPYAKPGAKPLDRPLARGAKKPVRGGKGDSVEDVDLNNLTIEVMKLDGDGKRNRRRGQKKSPVVGATTVGEDSDDKPQARRPARGGARPGVKPGGKPTGKPSVGVARHKTSARPRSLVSKKTAMPRREMPVLPPKPKQVRVHGDITTAQLAEKMRIDGADIIKKALLMGKMITLNDTIDQDLLEVLALELGYELEFIPDTDEADVEQYMKGRRDESRYTARPPVVTIMGHVDHGKTSLLEQIAKLEVLSTEHGGITQHIAAYHVHTSRGDVVFLDTPGHAAFTSMRMRGAQATDIVALVVAANDGVMPQTVEAINHAKAAGVPIVVAVNKIDLPEANPEKVKQQLMSYELVPEELGGQTLFSPISAKHGQGIDSLLETLLLQAEMLELHADPDGPADGIVLEARMNQQRGIEATVLVQQGTLRVGDLILAGQTFGRIRSMLDHLGRQVTEARPSFPARIYGLTGEAPEAGEPFLVMEDDREARQVAEKRAHRRRTAGLAKRPHISLEGLKDYLDGEEVKELHLILKGDVQGSIEAIEQSLAKVPSGKVRIHILHSAVGAVNETDVRLAEASDAIIIGFNVRPDNQAEIQAQQEGIEIKCYNVIYDLLSDIESAMVGMLDAKFKEVPQGKAEVLDTFKVSKVGTIAGCMVQEGEVRRDSNIRLVRDGKVVYTGKVCSLKRHKDDANRVQSGLECGIGLEKFNDVKKGDILESFSLQELEKTLV